MRLIALPATNVSRDLLHVWSWDRDNGYAIFDGIAMKGCFLFDQSEALIPWEIPTQSSIKRADFASKFRLVSNFTWVPGQVSLKLHASPWGKNTLGLSPAQQKRYKILPCAGEALVEFFDSINTYAKKRLRKLPCAGGALPKFLLGIKHLVSENVTKTALCWWSPAQIFFMYLFYYNDSTMIHGNTIKKIKLILTSDRNPKPNCVTKNVKPKHNDCQVVKLHFD